MRCCGKRLNKRLHARAILVANSIAAGKRMKVILAGGGDPLMPRYTPGDHVLLQLSRYELLRLQFRTGELSLPTCRVLRVFPAGHDGVHSYEVQRSSEPYSRVAREHELAPA